MITAMPNGEQFNWFDAWEELGDRQEPNACYARGPHITLDQMREEDVPALMQIELVAFPNPWSEGTYRTEANNRFARYGVIRANAESGVPQGTLLAYGGIWDQGFEAHITTIASHPDFRGKRLGETMLLFLLQLAVRTTAQTTTAVTLEVRPSNLPAQSLYKKWGFAEVGRRKHYYRDNLEDALIYTLDGIREPEFEHSVDQWLNHFIDTIRI
jgi:ribosomal-protein-alanine N-acetyltransferase